MKLTRDKRQATDDRKLRASQSDSCHRSLDARHLSGFTLLEVMFAVVAFCTATFAILALVSQSLDMARRLQRPMVDAGLVASQLSLTNSFVEGTKSGDLGDLLGDQYHGYTWDYAIEEAQTNKLFQVVIAVQSNEGSKPVVSKMTVLFYRPNSPAGQLDGGIGF
jgi:hypothetical protein